MISPISIKNLERSRRADAGSQRIQILDPDQRTPTQWKKFLSEGTNKEALAEFLYVAWKNADLTIVGKNLCLYIAHTNQCHCVTVKEGVQSVRVVEDLLLFLHAQHAAREHKAVIIKSSDTDVAVIAVRLQTDLPCSLYVFTGIGNRTRIIDITKVSCSRNQCVFSLDRNSHILWVTPQVPFMAKEKERHFMLHVRNMST